jgi:hypothetical protein
MKGIAVAFLPHRQLRSYPDCGDWQIREGGEPAIITVAQTGSDVSDMAVALHELIESFLCWKHGVREEAVTDFDRLFFAEQQAGMHAPDAEPGHDPRAPYREWHLAAERFEREFVLQAGSTWDQHCENVNRLYASPQESSDA